MIGGVLERRRGRRIARQEKRQRQRFAELIAFPPMVLVDPGDVVYAELAAIARRDGVSVGEAAARILQECLADDDQDTGNGDDHHGGDAA